MHPDSLTIARVKLAVSLLGIFATERFRVQTNIPLPFALMLCVEAQLFCLHILYHQIVTWQEEKIEQ